MGYALCSIGVIVLWVLLTVLRQLYPDSSFAVIMDCVAGYGLGGSTVAMFGRVGGGIFTKAADVGADLFGSFAESTCAALVIAAAGTHGVGLAGAGWDAVVFPVAISAAGIIVCMLCSFVATNIDP